MKKIIWMPFFVMVLSVSPLIFGQDSSLVAPADTVLTAQIEQPRLVEIRDLFSFSKIVSTIILLAGTFLFNRLLAFILGAIS